MLKLTCINLSLVTKTTTQVPKTTGLLQSCVIAVLANYLRHSDPALFSQFLLSFLTGVRVRQVGVEIFVQHLCSLLVEVTPLASDKGRQQIMTNMSCPYVTCNIEMAPLIKRVWLKDYINSVRKYAAISHRHTHTDDSSQKPQTKNKQTWRQGSASAES